MRSLFERAKYLARIDRVKRKMAERGIDLLLVASPANQFWLTGYDGWSFYTPQMVAVKIDAEEPVWIGRKTDAVGAKSALFLERRADAIPAQLNVQIAQLEAQGALMRAAGFVE